MKRGLLFFCCLLPVLLAACGETGQGTARGPADLIPSLTWQEPDKLDAAAAFTLTRSQEGYILVEIPDDGAVYLVVPAGQPVPEDLPDTVTPLCRPISDIYLAGSATMDMLVKLDALDSVSYSALPADDWTIPEARAAMESGSIVYAGKYSAPDYELICGGGCGLHICGGSRALWDDLIDSGIGTFSLDNIESMEEAKKVLGPHMFIMGNVPPIEVMRYGTPQDVLRSARDCIRQSYDSPCGYILTSGCQMPVGTPAENMTALMDAARIFGRWPVDPAVLAED